MERTALTAVATAGVAVVCCAGLPFLTALVGGLTVATLGVAAGLALVAGMAVALAVRSRRCNRSSRPDEHR